MIWNFLCGSLLKKFDEMESGYGGYALGGFYRGVN